MSTNILVSGFFLALLLLVCSSEVISNQLPIWGCGAQNRGKNSVSLVNVDFDASPIGLVQTPNFPGPFSLPLRCVWIFNNTQAKLTRKSWHLHFYFTQFYVSHELFTISTLNDTSELTEDLGWDHINSLGIESKHDWLHVTHIRTDDDLVLLKLNIESQSYDNLHRRVLEINEVYGFNITFQGSEDIEGVKGRCSLLECNLNGECFAETDAANPHQLSRFHCRCAQPKFNPTEQDEPFQGDRCQYHVKHKECRENQSATCKNGGTCRYYTSRFVTCNCKPGWTGHTCEIPSKSSVNNSSEIVSQNDRNCFYEYAQVEVETKIADLVMTHQNFTLVTSTFKVDSPTSNDSSTLIFRSSLPDIEHFLPKLEKDLNQALVELNLNTVLLPKASKFCAEKSLRLTTERRKGFVSEGDEFSLNCIAHGVKKPIFIWTKDYEYKIDVNLRGGHTNIQTSSIMGSKLEDSNRYIHFMTWAHEKHHETWSILTLKPANRFDDGLFTCTVYETFHENVNTTSSLSKFPHQTSSLKVEILRRPKIEVFPRSATLVKKSFDDFDGTAGPHRHPKGPNTLNCFAASDVDRNQAKHYRFYWMKNDINITELNNRTEHEEQMWVPHGKSLKLGLIQTHARYTCVAYDERDHTLSTNLTVEVAVAQTKDETCQQSNEGVIMWPQTYKGLTAYTKCTLASGYLSLQCSKDSHPKWSQQPDQSNCVRENLISWETLIERFLSGYVRKENDPEMLHHFIEDFNDKLTSKHLTLMEQKTTFKLLRKIFGMILHKNFQLNYTRMADDFFSSCLPVIINSLPSNTLSNSLEILELLRTSSQVFGSKLMSPNSSLQNQNTFNWTEPIMNGCFRNSSVAVKLVKASGSPKNGYNKLWTYPHQVAKEISKNEIVIDTGTSKESVGKLCAGSTRVSVALSSQLDKFMFKANPTLSIIHFKNLQENVEGEHQEIVNASFRFGFVRNSSIVTVIYGQDSNVMVAPSINISIRFLDAVFASENDSILFNLSCGRVNWQPMNQDSIWTRSDKNCQLKWHPEGMTCNCNSSGTYALVRFWTSFNDLDKSQTNTHAYIVTLCCGIGLTLASLALIFLLGQLKERITVLTIQHIQVCVLIIGILFTIIIAVAEFIPKDDNFVLSVTLQFFLLSALTSQLNVPAFVYFEGIWYRCAKHLTTIIFLLSYLVPTMYIGFTTGLLDLDPSRRSSWFIGSESEHFATYLTMNALLTIWYIGISLMTLRKFKRINANNPNWSSLLKHSAWIFATILVLNLSSLNYVNDFQKLGKEYLLGIPCAFVGVILFCCFVMKNNRGFSSDHSKRTSKNDPERDCCIDIQKKGSNAGVSFRKDENYLSDLRGNANSNRNEYHYRTSLTSESAKLKEKDGETSYSSDSSEPSIRLLSRNRLGQDSFKKSFRSENGSGTKNSFKLRSANSPFPPNLDDIMEWNDASGGMSHVPLAELLKGVDDPDCMPLTRADIHSTEPTKLGRKPGTLTVGSNGSTCSSYDSALPRSRGNTSSGSNTIRTLSNASDNSKVMESVSDSIQSAEYVLMSAPIKWIPPQMESESGNGNEIFYDRSNSSSSDRDTDSLLCPTKNNENYRKSFSGESASHSSEVDSSDLNEDTATDGMIIFSTVPANLSDFQGIPNGRSVISSRMKRRKCRRSIPPSRSLPIIFTQKFQKK